MLWKIISVVGPWVIIIVGLALLIQLFVWAAQIGSDAAREMQLRAEERRRRKAARKAARNNRR